MKASSVLQNLETEMQKQPTQGRTPVSSAGGLKQAQASTANSSVFIYSLLHVDVLSISADNKIRTDVFLSR